MNDFEKAIAQCNYETLPNEDMRIVAEELGMDTAIKLMKHLAGHRIYIPKNPLRNAIDGIVDKGIRRGESVADISRKTHLSKSTLYSRIKKM